MALVGVATFDREKSRLTSVEVKRKETRKPGVVEAGLEVESVLKDSRSPSDVKPGEIDQRMASRPAIAPADWERLMYKAPGEGWSIDFDRSWHVVAEDSKAVVLRKVEGGQVLAQVNFAAAPKVAAGTHQDLGRFRDDIRKAIGNRFVRFLGAGETRGAAAGGFRYKVAVLGKQGNDDLVWYYYLVASPAGDQLMATFTMRESQAKRLGDEDVRLMGSLEWINPRP
jgi:hypothetical protein